MSTLHVHRPLLAAVLLAAAPAARADDAPPPVNRLIPSAFVVFRFYPEGQDTQASLTYKQRIGDSDDVLFKTRFWSVGALAAWNPANWSARLEAMVEPIAVFQLRAAYDAKGYFGNYGALISSTDPNQNITEEYLKAASARDEDYPGVVHSLTVEPALQVAFGPLAIRNTFALEYGAWPVRSGDTFVWDPGPDVLRPANGWTLTNTATAGYLGDRFFAGALYQWLNPVGVPGNQIHRVGAIGTFTFFDRGPGNGGWFNKPTLLVLTLFNLQHRGRLAYIPTVVAGIGAEGDLLGPAPARIPTP